MSSAPEAIPRLLTDYSERLVLAAFVLVVFVAAGWLVARLLQRVGRRTSLRASRVYRLVAGSANTLIVGAGTISALGTLGVNITALVAGLGLTGFALGLALKDAISNLVAGVMIIVYAPFDIDDDIELGGIRGKVVELDLHYVTLRTDTEVVLIPNSNFITSVVRKTA